MPYRIDYRASVSLTDSQHQTVYDAVQTWADADPSRHVTGINRNPESGQTEIVVYVDGLTYDQMATIMDQIKTGVENLPETWPDPTQEATPSQYSN